MALSPLPTKTEIGNNMSEQLNLEQIVAEMFENLTPRERYILEQRCGYHGDPITQTKIAAEFYISRVRVGQIENTAIRKMRKPYPRIKMLQEYLPTVLFCENENFYSRLLIKLFRLKPEQVLELFKQEVRKCLMKSLPLAGDEYVEERMKLYKDAFSQFLKDGWTPSGVAAALMVGA